MAILGISAYYHDSAAALVQDGSIIAAAQEERFTRKKHDPSFPTNAVRFCLTQSGAGINELDAIVFYDKPLLKFERLLETYYAVSPKGLNSFIAAIPVWIKEKMFLRKMIVDELSEIETFDKKKLKLLFSEHHLSHAASAFYPSPFAEAAIITIDGVGEWATASIAHGKGSSIKILKELRFPHSIGLLYSSFTYYAGFKVNSGEYKLMGLAPYGNGDSDTVKRYIAIIYSELVDVKEDGSIWLNQEYFDYAHGLRMVNERKWESLFGFPRRKSESELLQCHCDLALAIQTVTEDVVIRMATEAKRLTGSDYLCMAGGVALNCVANGKLLKKNVFRDIWIQPAAGDAGGALGAALAVHHGYFGKERTVTGDNMQGAYLGPDFSDKEIEGAARRFKAVWKHYESDDTLCSTVAGYIANGKVIGWFQGRMEWGPRALGARSIIADPRSPEMQKRMNLKIKFRESFRPFAPSVLYEHVGEYFDLTGQSPYMLLIANVVEGRRKTLPPNYDSLSVRDKLYFQRSDMPAITHVDYSARIQTVHRNTNGKYWLLIDKFRELTGYAVIVNTSFNVRGEPIVCTPEDAYRCFMRTDIDYLVMSNYVFERSAQPPWLEEKNWKEDYVLD